MDHPLSHPTTPDALATLARLLASDAALVLDAVARLPSRHRALFAVYLSKHKHLHKLACLVACECEEAMLRDIGGSAGAFLYAVSRGGTFTASKPTNSLGRWWRRPRAA